MAISTIGTYIGFATSSAGPFTEYFQMVDYPDFSSTPDTIDATTMVDKEEVLLKGLKRQQQMEFTANYSPEVYHELESMTYRHVCIVFSDYSFFTSYGTIDVAIVAGSVNDVVKMRVTLTRENEWTLHGSVDSVSKKWKPDKASRSKPTGSDYYTITIPSSS